ncbi:MAG: efflux RND transporter periplasmic adaptor subunit [Treponema sp.]|jgi:multidrug efflux pump subunit AcrA (membrane-fusion protein)|nr:efflux RND transporter periplasmic adaptor subunit [Treponema sp.]
MKKNKGRVTVILIFLTVVFCALSAFTLLSVFFPRQTRAEASALSAAGAGPESGAGAGTRQGAETRRQDGAGRERAAGAETGRGQGTAVRLQTVAAGTVENTIVLSGDVLSASQVSIYPDVAGKLTSLRVKAGDRVGRGTVVAMVDPSRPGDSFFASPVTSTVAGAVLSVPVTAGETLQTGSVICVVGDLSALRVETWVPERYTVYMKRGIKAEVRFEALGEERFEAEVDEVSPVLDPASRTMRISLRLLPGADGRVDSRILAGMFATVGLVTNSRTGVPVIPRGALINTYGKWVVFVVPPGTSGARRREVSIGLESEDTVEITGGLETGERVVTAGQNFLSDGDTVRIVE